ncbi:MAG: MmcQ/YjbR family DNA-binding protein [Clostridiales bacterium]|nr:MmcQ/YjbR family DNA-binding protein [Clostridiales bacterium]
MRKNITDYIKARYDVSPEYPWEKYDDNAVFRHLDNRKWFALIMDVGRDKLGLEGEDTVSVINLKINDVILRDMLIAQDGIMPAYHMNKLHWITVLLDGTVPQDQVEGLIEVSYKATETVRRGGRKKNEARGPKEWIIPANPKFYDVIGAFERSCEIDWKQGAGIRCGDTVYMYVASPVSAILYKCKVTETDIPYDYSDKNLTIRSLMKIKLEKRYKEDEFTFARLGEDFGIFAIRGPRGVPYSLSCELNKTTSDMPSV